MNEGTLRKLFFVGLIAVALLQALAYSSTAYSTDDCAYLDQAVLFSQFDFKQGVNGYWSPLYPFLAGVMIKIFNLPISQQLFAIKIMNVGIFAVTLICFDYFLQRFLDYKDGFADPDKYAQLSRRQWIVVANCLFAWTFLYIGGVQQATPDYLVAASLFLSTGIAIGIYKRKVLRDFALMGAVLGLGYLAKASMIPATVVLAALAAAGLPGMKSRVIGATIALACAATIASPYWVVLTIKTGRLSLGSSAGLNYMIWVNPGYSILGNNPAEIDRTLDHPMVTLSRIPRIAVFEDVLPATYPPWFDPAYFAQGLKVVFSPAGSLVVMVLNVVFLFCLFGWQLLLMELAGRICLPGAGIKFAGMRKAMIVWLPSAITTLGICTVISLPLGFSTPRYFPSTVVLIYLVYLAVRRYPNDEKGAKALTASMITACAISILFFIAGLSRDLMRLGGGRVDVPAKVAVELTEMGLKPGDKVVLIGKECGEWARLAGLRIAAIVTSEAREQDADDPVFLSSIVEKLKSGTGARAAVYFPKPISENMLDEEALMDSYRKLFFSVTGMKLHAPPARSQFSREALKQWRKLDDVDAYVYFLR